MDYILILALSFDTLLACMAYGTKKIKVPILSKLVIVCVGTAFLAISIVFGGILQELISSKVLSIIGFTVLMLIGLMNLFESIIKKFLSKYATSEKPLNIKCFDLNFAVNIYLDKTNADADNSKSLSCKEAFLLAIPLSIDSLITGLSVVSSWRADLILLTFSIVCGFIFATIGTCIGIKISNNSYDLSWISGIVLICIAVFKLIA